MNRRHLCFFLALLLTTAVAGAARAQSATATTEQAEQEFPVYIRQLMAESDAGNAASMSELANAYYVGIGVPKNLPEAIRLWRLASEGGDGRAFSMLGTLQYQGIGMQRDSAEAIRLWQKGAEKYDTDAMSQIGFAYLVGDSVPRNQTMAYMWFNLAASNGDKLAAKSRDSVAMMLGADQVAEAQRLGNEWQQQHPKPAPPAPPPKVELARPALSAPKPIP